ncbi:MAG: sulfotransferase [Novipirellula sp. JB048]
MSDERLAQQLKSWIVPRKAEASRDKTVAGGKYPHLCRFIEHLHTALGDSLRIIAVNRDIEASIRSLQDRSGKHAGQWFAADDEACERLQRNLLEHRDQFINAHPEVSVFKIEFAELTSHPEKVIRSLIEFLGIQPTDDELASAIAHVKPELRKHG